MLTESDLHQIGKIVHDEVGGVRGEMKSLGEDLRGEMKSLGEDLRGEMKGLGDDLRGEMKVQGEDLRREMKGFHEDLKGDFRYLSSQISRLDGKVDGAEDRLGKKIDEVMSHVDGFTKNQEKFDTELVSHQSALKRLGAYPANP